VVIDVESLEAGRGGRVIDGPPLDGTTVARLLCDSSLHRVLMGGRSAVIDYGTSTRTIPAPLWAALVIRDEHCRFPGCDRPSTWCEGHHVTWVSNGGTTDLDNLVLVCTRHHHRLHQPGWQAKLRPDATLEVTDGDGLVRCTSPPRTRPGW
jgi:HNH endonuclease